MKLRFSPTSPYVRKVMVTAIELNLEDRIEKIVTNPWVEDTDLVHDNPLGKVPVLIAADGSPYYDSRVICEFLDGLNGQPRLFPTDDSRWLALRLQALADGILDASVARFLEGKRAPERQSESWLARQRASVHRALDAMEREVQSWAGGLHIGHIAVGCALGYVSFRFADDEWQRERRNLKQWFEEFSQRHSMQATVPVAPAGG